jgi:hypothetical protein
MIYYVVTYVFPVKIFIMIWEKYTIIFSTAETTWLIQLPVQFVLVTFPVCFEFLRAGVHKFLTVFHLSIRRRWSFLTKRMMCCQLRHKKGVLTSLIPQSGSFSKAWNFIFCTTFLSFWLYYIYPCFSSSKPGRKRVKKVVDKTYMDAAG